MLQFVAKAAITPKAASQGASKYDSFVTHRKMIPNLKFIEKCGIKEFLNEQKK